MNNNEYKHICKRCNITCTYGYSTPYGFYCIECWDTHAKAIQLNYVKAEISDMKQDYNASMENTMAQS